MQHKNARLAEAVATVVASGAHIVCLQEADRHNVTTALAAAGFPYVTSRAFGDGSNAATSGLVFASKFPIVKQGFWKFNASFAGSADALADKGVFGAVVKVCVWRCVLCGSVGCACERLWVCGACVWLCV